MFIGSTVQQVAFSANTLFISFGNEISITILASFEHLVTPAENESNGVQRVPVKESRLMQLIDHAVESVEASVDGTLTLHFNNGQTLRCFDDSPQYESYWITHGKKEIYV